MKNHLMKEDLLSTPKLNVDSHKLFFFFDVTLAQILFTTGSSYVKIRAFAAVELNVQNNQLWCPQQGNKGGDRHFPLL